MSNYQKIDEYKSIIDKVRPFEGNMLKQIQDYYRIGLTWSSNALEGNTLTISETKILLEDGLTVGGKPLKDTFEALGHSKAYDFMFSLLHNRYISEEDILMFHQLFYSDIDKKHAGKYRNEHVFISCSNYEVCSPGDIPQQMQALVKWVREERDKYHPVTFAALLHKKFVFIHPFIDGNGRIARLLMNTSLIQDGYVLAIIPPVLRLEYIQLLEKAHIDDTSFIDFIAELVLESEREIIRLLHIDVD